MGEDDAPEAVEDDANGFKDINQCQWIVLHLKYKQYLNTCINIMYHVPLVQRPGGGGQARPMDRVL